MKHTFFTHWTFYFLLLLQKKAAARLWRDERDCVPAIKRDHENQTNFFFHTKPAKTWLEKIAVRTFRGRQPHLTEFRTERWPEKVAGACQLVR